MGKLLYAAVSYLLFLGSILWTIAFLGNLEERDLRASLGDAYDEYRKEVRMLLPIPRRTK